MKELLDDVIQGYGSARSGIGKGRREDRGGGGRLRQRRQERQEGKVTRGRGMEGKEKGETVKVK